MEGSALKSFCQMRWLITATGGAPALASSGTRPRPKNALIPRNSNASFLIGVEHVQAAVANDVFEDVVLVFEIEVLGN